jgi:mRNA-degrading endonuclease toxin of MazEF toxin-antitoxin module
MDEIRRGELWWVDRTPEPRGSEPRFRHAVVVVQDDDAFNRSDLATVIVVVLTVRSTSSAAHSFTSRSSMIDLLAILSKHCLDPNSDT